MTSIRQTTMVTSSSSTSGGNPSLLLDGASPLDGSLDALLEDLQNSVSRPGSSLGMANHNGPTSGGGTTSRVVQQREVRVQRSGGGVPSVQYLQPANTTTVVTERASSPLLMQASAGPERVTSYKTYQYQYRTSDAAPVSGLVVDGSSHNSPSMSPPAPPTQKVVTTYTETVPPPSDNRLRQNLNELDSLLVDLHHAQQSTPNVDPNSQTAQQISRTVRTYQFDNTYGTPNSVRRELYPSSPKPERSSRAKSPAAHHTSYTSSSTVRASPSSPIRTQSPIRSQSPIRAPSPTRKVTTTVKTYTYEIPADPHAAVPPQVVTSPTVKTYSYDIPSDKPSPPPEDTIITYKYTTIPRNQPEPVPEPTIVKTYKYPSQPIEREPLIESPAPKQPHPNMNNTYITYNYSSTNHTSHPPNNVSPSPNYTKVIREPTHRPFPTPVPTPPASAEPPKRLDELMASFSDAEMVDTSPERPVPQRPVPASPLDDYPDATVNNVTPARPAAPVQERQRTKNIAGPPVYYPPGVELFSRKDEPVHAKMKDGAASPADGGAKGSGVGVAAVPVCLPLCCAMPCVIL